MKRDHGKRRLTLLDQIGLAGAQTKKQRKLGRLGKKKRNLGSRSKGINWVKITSKNGIEGRYKRLERITRIGVLTWVFRIGGWE